MRKTITILLLFVLTSCCNKFKFYTGDVAGYKNNAAVIIDMAQAIELRNGKEKFRGIYYQIVYLKDDTLINMVVKQNKLKRIKNK